MGKKYQHRRLRKFFDTMEHQKTTQLDWLRDNYNMQASICTRINVYRKQRPLPFSLQH